MPQCPNCYEIVASHLTECPRCHSSLTPPSGQQPYPAGFSQNYPPPPPPGPQSPPAYSPYQQPPPQAYGQPPQYGQPHPAPQNSPPQQESRLRSKLHIIAAILAGIIVGYFIPILGLLVALFVGVVLYHALNPGKTMAPKQGQEQKFIFKLIYVIGLILVVLILFLPVSDEGLYISSFRNPPTYMNYLSILFLEPDSITSTAVQVRSPGLPMLVVPALVLIILGALLPGGLLQKRMKILVILSGLVILTVAPIISHFAVGATGDILYDYNFMFWLGWVGMAMILASEFLPDRISAPQAAYALMFFIPVAAAISQADPNHVTVHQETWAGDFESAHHSIAGILAGLLGGLAGGSSAEELEPESYTLELTYPAGRSPNVFTTGWLFGARCIVNQGTPKEEDLSGIVEWSGTGSFNPGTGTRSRPSFSAPGKNKITLTCKDGVKTRKRSFTVNAVEPWGYAHLGTMVKVPADAHGCPACPHCCVGPIASGSPHVLVNGMPAARVGDGGAHAACCGPNQFTIATGDSSVLIDGRPAARKPGPGGLGDATTHCGGVGHIIG